MYLAGLIGQICASTAHYRLTKACGPNVIVFGHYYSKKNSYFLATSFIFENFTDALIIINNSIKMPKCKK
jgi:hypothetical protein